jgi:uncharacterized membrane protein YfcA
MIHIAAGVCLGILSAWFYHVLQLMMISVALGVCLGIVAAYMLIKLPGQIARWNLRRQANEHLAPPPAGRDWLEDYLAAIKRDQP